MGGGNQKPGSRPDTSHQNQNDKTIQNNRQNRHFQTPEPGSYDNTPEGLVLPLFALFHTRLFVLKGSAKQVHIEHNSHDKDDIRLIILAFSYVTNVSSHLFLHCTVRNPYKLKPQCLLATSQITIQSHLV